MGIVAAVLLASVAFAGNRLPRLTYEIGCLAEGKFGALIIGKGTVDQQIDWSPDKKFVVLGNTGVSNYLEGESGYLNFSLSEYSNGVWVRWTYQVRTVTHIPVPDAC